MSSAPKIAVVGFGAAGIGFTHALRHSSNFITAGGTFQPKITVFEANPDLGGKIAPRNLGAQFLDVDAFYPMDRIVKDLKLPLSRPRGDYDNAPFTLHSGKVMAANQFLQTVCQLRENSREALKNLSWKKLDELGGVGFLNQLNRAGQLSDEELDAMTCRLIIEEGTVYISALSLAINLAKGISPVKRVEVKGGLHKIATQEALALTEYGAQVLTNQRVRRIEVLKEGIHLYTQPEQTPSHFDYALLACSPEQLKKIQITGSSFPHRFFAKMKPARITKSNLWLGNTNLRAPETANPRYAMWHTQLDGDKAYTFFHGGEGCQALKPAQLRNAARLKSATSGNLESKTWDGKSNNDELPASYTTIPYSSEGWPTVKCISKYLIEGAFANERLLFANHVLGAGCYTRDGALAGEWAAIWLLKALGFDISPALENRPNRYQDFFGVPVIKD